jgi:hypothetical protein
MWEFDGKSANCRKVDEVGVGRGLDRRWVFISLLGCWNKRQELDPTGTDEPRSSRFDRFVSSLRVTLFHFICIVSLSVFAVWPGGSTQASAPPSLRWLSAGSRFFL